MAAFLLACLSAMVIAYALVALTTVNLWRLVPRGEDGNGADRPKRAVPGEALGRTRKRRCPEAAHRPPRAAAGRGARTAVAATDGLERAASVTAGEVGRAFVGARTCSL